MTHGRGKKAGRGAGLRGGRGNAGLGKHKFMYMIKNMPDHFGKYGFKRPQGIVKRDNTINVGQLEEKFPGKKEINLTKEGFDKLLGTGNITYSIKIKVNSASQKAKDKVKEKGGDVLLPEKPKKETVEKSEDEVPIEKPQEETVEENVEDEKVKES
jgi:large subunit ribosomal protein L15